MPPPPPGHVNYITLDVFTRTAYTGNPLAVVFLPPPSSTNNTTTLTHHQKQTLAREFNFSETIFIHPATAGHQTHRTIDIFTPTDELPFAGHPTIGAAVWFLHLRSASPGTSPHHHPKPENGITHLITKSGTIPIAPVLASSPSPSLSPSIPSKPTPTPTPTPAPSQGEGVTARIAQNPHQHRKRVPVRELLRLHGSLAPFFASNPLGEDSGQGQQQQQQQQQEEKISFPVFSIVRGMSQVLVEVPSLAALDAVTTSAGGRWWARRVGPDTGKEGKGSKEVIRTRAVIGNVEDPATGSAACGLAAYLALSQGTPKEKKMVFEFVQGVEMGRRSEIGVEVEMGDDARTIAHVDLKGNAVKVSEGTIAIPPE